MREFLQRDGEGRRDTSSLSRARPLSLSLSLCPSVSLSPSLCLSLSLSLSSLSTALLSHVNEGGGSSVTRRRWSCSPTPTPGLSTLRFVRRAAPRGSAPRPSPLTNRTRRVPRPRTNRTRRVPRSRTNRTRRGEGHLGGTPSAASSSRGPTPERRSSLGESSAPAHSTICFRREGARRSVLKLGQIKLDLTESLTKKAHSSGERVRGHGREVA